MIDRIVLFKLKDAYASEEGRREVAEHTQAMLRDLPGVVSLSIGTPADEAAARSWDLSIVLRFARLEDVEAYRIHPEHRRYVDDYMKPRMEVVKAWNMGVHAVAGLKTRRRPPKEA